MYRSFWTANAVLIVLLLFVVDQELSSSQHGTSVVQGAPIVDHANIKAGQAPEPFIHLLHGSNLSLARHKVPHAMILGLPEMINPMMQG